MSEVQLNNLGIESGFNAPIEANTLPPRAYAPYVSRRGMTVDEFWRREKRKNTGLIERLYNGIKNLTGIGTGSKKVDKALGDVKSGKISQKDFNKKVQNYNSSQETSAQLLGDGASFVAGLWIFRKLFKKAKIQQSKLQLNPLLEKEILDNKKSSWWLKKLTKIAKSNTKILCVSAGLAALGAGFAKALTLVINRIGSKEYNLDERIYGRKGARSARMKHAAKYAKSDLRSDRWGTNFRNFISGAVNGLMSPLITLGGIIGAPLYLVGNSLNRYFVASKTDKNKSFGSYIDNITNDGITTGVVTAAMAVPLVKKGNYLKVFNENINKVTEKLMKADLKHPDFPTTSAYSELERAMFKSEKIAEIVNNENMLPEEQIKRLTEENIFAVKFKQISADESQLTNALREKCPSTRTLSEAQTYINDKLGSGYQVQQLLGVGTIAETYLAKDPSGKEVCLKVLKNGISKEKILNDKAKFVELINNLNKSKDEKDYLLRNLEDLSESVLKEVDFKNELEAAKALVPHTQVANVVKPIDVKNGVYIMEKAEGISLSSLVDLNEAKMFRDMLKKSDVPLEDLPLGEMYAPKKNSKLYFELEGKKTKQEQLEAIEKYIQRIEARTPQFSDISLTKEDTNYLLKEYMRVLIEQFNKVEKDGKVLHADIHPGNIFIDMNALKSRKGKIFTLIDTGNTLKLKPEQMMRSINLTSFVKRGDVPDLAEYVLEGAILPKGLTHEEAVKKISEDLKKCFFDYETSLDRITNDTVLTLSSNIMRKYGIVPSDTQLNLNKAKRSAANSLHNMADALVKVSFKDVDSQAGAFKAIGALLKDVYLIDRKYKGLIAEQEKQNLKLLSLAEQIKYKKNPNLLATNSEEFLTYRLKQLKVDDRINKLAEEK